MISTTYIFIYNQLRPIFEPLHLINENIFNILLFIAFLLSVIYFYILINSIFLKRKERKYEFDTEKAPFVTVQIPTYNELVAIRCAKQCLEFDYPKDKYEIIIGDDSNKPEISKKIDEFAKSHDLIKVTRRGNNIGYKPGNLNHMLKYTKGEIMVLFDSDFVPQKDFLKKIITPFKEDEKICAVQARWSSLNTNQNLISILGSTIISVVHHIVLPFIYNKRKISFLCGSAEAVKKETLLKLGGWKNGSLTEDIEYSLRAIKNGYRIVYLEDLKCKGEVPYRPKDLYKQQMRWAYGVIKSFIEHDKDIITNKTIKLKDKVFINFVCNGYLLTILIFGLLITGLINAITADPTITSSLGMMLLKTAKSIAMSSGILTAAIVAQIKIHNYKKIIHMLTSTFSYGFVVTYHVNKGIFKAFTKQPMEWFMLNKKGNEIIN